jgi:hypothetical protein
MFAFFSVLLFNVYPLHTATVFHSRRKRSEKFAKVGKEAEKAGAISDPCLSLACFLML